MVRSVYKHRRSGPSRCNCKTAGHMGLIPEASNLTRRQRRRQNATTIAASNSKPFHYVLSTYTGQILIVSVESDGHWVHDRNPILTNYNSDGTEKHSRGSSYLYEREREDLLQ
jgi:hypothetical protein